MSVITATNVTVGWQGTAVARVNEFCLKQGEIVVIAGPNGAGKSTLLKTLAAQIKAVSGSLRIDQHDFNAMTPREFATKVAYVPQFPETPHHITVEELVALGRTPHQKWWTWDSSTSDRSALDFAMQHCDLEGMRKRTVKELSGGERQRVWIAMAVAQETDFILLDEPTSHLDFKRQLQLLEWLRRLRQMGKGILLILHDLNLIGQVADRLILLSKSDRLDNVSQVIAEGTPTEVLNASTLRQAYQVEVAVIRDEKTGYIGYVPTTVVENKDRTP